MNVKISIINMIDCQEFDRIVMEAYGGTYSFQQQDGCKSRRNVCVSAPSDGYDYENDAVSEIVNHSDMEVSFWAWLARDSK